MPSHHHHRQTSLTCLLVRVFGECVNVYILPKLNKRQQTAHARCGDPQLL